MNSDSNSILAFMTSGLYLGMVALFYVINAIAIMTIAKKTDTPDGWMAWIPILNILLMLKIAGLDWWYLLLLFIPCIGGLVGLYIWWQICEARGKPGWLAVLLLVPCVGFGVPLYVAFSD